MSQQIQFRVHKENCRTIRLPNNIQIRHVYPTLADFLGGRTPSDINPRSHGPECLKGKLPKEIENTIRNEPETFVLANRGCTILASSVDYDNATETMTVTFENYRDKEQLNLKTNEWAVAEKATNGMVDGATTDAVIAKIQNELKEQLADIARTTQGSLNSLQDAFLHLEIITGVQDRETISALAEGRNTGRQVRAWSMANFNGRYDWLKAILDQGPFANRIAYEENAEDKDIEILDVIALLNLFHKSYCDGSTKSPNVSYNSKKQGLLRRIEDEMSPTAKDLQRLSNVVFIILELRDRLISSFPKLWNGRIGVSPAFKPLEKAATLPFSGELATHQVPDGVLFPLLASLRSILSYPQEDQAEWLTNPFRFWEKHGEELVEKLQGQLDSPIYTTVTQFGQKAGNYSALLDAATLCYYRDKASQASQASQASR